MMATSLPVANVSTHPSPVRRRAHGMKRPRVDVLGRVALVTAALVLIAVLQTLLFLGLS